MPTYTATYKPNPGLQPVGWGDAISNTTGTAGNALAFTGLIGRGAKGSPKSAYLARFDLHAPPAAGDQFPTDYTGLTITKASCRTQISNTAIVQGGFGLIRLGLMDKWAGGTVQKWRFPVSAFHSSAYPLATNLPKITDDSDAVIAGRLYNDTWLAPNTGYDTTLVAGIDHYFTEGYAIPAGHQGVVMTDLISQITSYLKEPPAAAGIAGVIGFAIEPYFLPNAAERYFIWQQEALTTFGKWGMRLRLEWDIDTPIIEDLPRIELGEIEVIPAVAAALQATPAVDVDGMDTTQAVDAHGLDTTPAVAVDGMEATPAVTVDGLDTTPAVTVEGLETDPAVAAALQAIPAVDVNGLATTPAATADALETTPAVDVTGLETTPAADAEVSVEEETDQ